MKKFTGNYTTEAGKVLKGSERLICAVAAEDEIYISNGYVLYKMNRFEYAATIKGAHTAAPVVWLTGETEKHADKIEAAGAMWSNKKSAYYVRVA